MSKLTLARNLAFKHATRQRDHVYRDPADIIERMIQYGEEPKNAVYMFTNEFLDAFRRSQFPEYANEEDAEKIAWTEKEAYERFVETYVRNTPGLLLEDFPSGQTFFYVLRSELKKMPRNLQASSDRIDQKLRRTLNDAFHRAGMDGNGRFRSTGEGINALTRVLEDHGLEPDQVFDAHTFGRPSGSEPVYLAFKHPTDPFSPIPVSNSVLHVQWTELSPNNYEYLVYVG